MWIVIAIIALIVISLIMILLKHAYDRIEILEMEYFLTKMTCQISPIDDEIEVIQLVKATTPELARDAVREAAIEDQGENIIIFEIRIQETLIAR